MTKPYNDDYEWLKEDIANCENDWQGQCPSVWIGIAKDLLVTVAQLNNQITVGLIRECELTESLDKVEKENSKLKDELEELKEILRTINKHGQ